VVIAAERRGDRVEQLIEKIVEATGDQEAALSAIDLTELIHGIYRAQTPEIRLRRESFLNELLAELDGLSVNERNRSAGRQNRRRAAEPRRSDSVRGLTDRSHGAVTRLPRAHR
jgi:predicted nucleic acid-binding protein